MLQSAPSIEPAISYIAGNYMNEISVGMLAGLCHVSVSHFRRLFRQVLGWAPQEYIQIVRIDRACAMLYNRDCSVTEISSSVGLPFALELQSPVSANLSHVSQPVAAKDQPGGKPGGHGVL